MFAIRNVVFKVKVKVDKQRSCFIYLFFWFHVWTFRLLLFKHLPWLLDAFCCFHRITIHAVTDDRIVIRRQWNATPETWNVDLNLSFWIYYSSDLFGLFDFDDIIQENRDTFHAFFFFIFFSFLGIFWSLTYENKKKTSLFDRQWEISMRFFFWFLFIYHSLHE